MAMSKSVTASFLLLLASAAASAQDLSMNYTFSTILDQSNSYSLYWTFDQAAKTIAFAVRVQTTGWVGFGLSPNGQMPGSDVVIGWVDNANNKPYFHDRFAEARAEPPIDQQQDWFLVGAQEDNGYTVLEFTRNFTTCDPKDIEVKMETARIVFSWSDSDPVVTTSSTDGSETYSLSQHDIAGSTSLNLLGGNPSSPGDPPGLKTFTVGGMNISVPSEQTSYWCVGIELPATQQVQYIVKFKPSITAGNEKLVHHMLVYVCDILEESDLSPSGAECFQASSRINRCLFDVLVGAWAVGGDEFVYPENVAYPIGGPGSPRYAVIQLHYNNDDGTSGVIDSSGITFGYISNPREHNAGILMVGHAVSTNMIVPQNAQNFTVSSFCSSTCTSALFPEGGIHIFANLLHTHLAGIGLKLTRDQQNDACSTSRYEEVDIIERNLNYDFNFQQFTHLAQEVTVLPGDILSLQCYYNTVGRTSPVFGGESTLEEMCLAFMVYYPLAELSICLSQPTYSNFSGFVDNYVPSEFQDEFRLLTESDSLSKVVDTFNLLDWTPEQIQGFQTVVYSDGEQMVFCSNSDSSVQLQQTQYSTTACCVYQDPDTCNRDASPQSCCDQTCPDPRSVSGASSLTLSFIPTLITVLGLTALYQ